MLNMKMLREFTAIKFKRCLNTCILPQLVGTLCVTASFCDVICEVLVLMPSQIVLLMTLTLRLGSQTQSCSSVFDQR